MSDETCDGYTPTHYAAAALWQEGYEQAAQDVDALVARAEKAEAERDDARRERAREISAGQLGYTALAEFDYRNLPNGTAHLGVRICRLDICPTCDGAATTTRLKTFDPAHDVPPCPACLTDRDGNPLGVVAVPVEADG
jgi:hypothetical protein